MEIRITFDGGPLHGQSALTDGLDEIKVFFPPRDQTVLAYRRFNETIYAYSQDMSERMTAGYAKTRDYFSKRDPSSIRFEDEAGPIEPIEPSEPVIGFENEFSNDPIEDEDGGTE